MKPKHPSLTSWPPCPAPGLVPLVDSAARGQREGGCPPLSTEARPGQRSPGTPDPTGDTDLIDRGSGLHQGLLPRLPVYLKISPKYQQLPALRWREAGGYRLSPPPGCLKWRLGMPPATEGGGDLELAPLLCDSLQAGTSGLGAGASSESALGDVRGWAPCAPTTPGSPRGFLGGLLLCPRPFTPTSLPG